MRAILLHLIAMMITFALGVGFVRVWPKSDVNCGPIVGENRAQAKADEPHLLFDHSSRFSPNGTFYINGPTPPELTDFLGIDVWEKEIDGRISRYVGILNQSRNVYSSQPAVFAAVTDRRLFLVTGHSQTGSEYRFEGDFFNNNGNIPTNDVGLRGTLIKFEHGLKVFEGLVTFHCEGNGCFWRRG